MPNPITVIAPRPTPPALVGRIVNQVYRDPIPGSTPQAKADNLHRLVDSFAKEDRAPAVCFHGFPGELEHQWDRLAGYAQGANVLALAAWGLDTERLSGRAKGQAMAAVLKRSSCAAGLADMEGRWDVRTGAGDNTDEDDALAMGEAVRADAPGATVGDQCWPIIGAHGDVRTLRRPLEAGGVFAGFPVDECAVQLVNWARFRQLYPNEAGFVRRWGTARYARMRAWMDSSWAPVQRALALDGLDRPLAVTLQCYGWDDIPADLCDAMLRYGACAAQVVIGWYNPGKDCALWRRYTRFVHALVDGGLAAPGYDPVEVVKSYQRMHNATPGALPLLAVDGRAGLKTLVAFEAERGVSP